MLTQRKAANRPTVRIGRQRLAIREARLPSYAYRLHGQENSHSLDLLAPGAIRATGSNTRCFINNPVVLFSHGSTDEMSGSVSACKNPSGILTLSQRCLPSNKIST
jgi:hypothetical protein